MQRLALQMVSDSERTTERNEMFPNLKKEERCFALGFNPSGFGHSR